MSTDPSKITKIMAGGFLAHKKKLIAMVLAILGLLGAYLTGDADLVTFMSELFSTATSSTPDVLPTVSSGG